MMRTPAAPSVDTHHPGVAKPRAETQVEEPMEVDDEESPGASLVSDEPSSLTNHEEEMARLKAQVAKMEALLQSQPQSAQGSQESNPTPSSESPAEGSADQVTGGEGGG